MMLDLRVTEGDVRSAAKALGYELVSFPGGYELLRGDERKQETVVASTLELIVDFLRH